MEEVVGRVAREKEFHNASPTLTRRVMDRMAESFYAKDQFWESVWQEWPISGKTVLDYGCGIGDFSIELAKRGAIVYGIDISERQIETAHNSVPSSIRSPEFSVADSHATNFPDGTFDFVFGNAILHHLDLRKSYAEISRVLKPGGKAAFLEPLDRHPLVSLWRLLTPHVRSVDEEPLTFEEVALASQYFGKICHKEYFLLGVAAAPLHLVSRKAARATLRFLSSVDRQIFKRVPVCRSYAWLTFIKLEKISDGAGLFPR